MSNGMRNGLYINSNGTKRWYRNDRYHRIDGPAIEYKDGSKRWIKYGLDHRIGGPAVEFVNCKEYWLYNDEYSEEEYNKAMSNLPLLYWNRFKKGLWL